jgi:hypothetical protein
VCLASALEKETEMRGKLRSVWFWHFRAGLWLLQDWVHELMLHWKLMMTEMLRVTLRRPAPQSPETCAWNKRSSDSQSNIHNFSPELWKSGTACLILTFTTVLIKAAKGQLKDRQGQHTCASYLK